MADKGTKCKSYTKSKPGSLDCSKGLIEELKKKTDNKSIKLPQYISFIFEADSTLLIYIQEQIDDSGEPINALTKNMQGDNSAFEGWAVVLKAWCPDKVSKVRLKWDVPLGKEDNPHYRRFCYRVVKMLDAYEWFSIDSANSNSIVSFKQNELTNLKNNCGNKIPEKKFKHGGAVGENAVEYDMVHEQDFSQKMCNKYSVDNIYHQLPVGVKKKGESFFAGTKAAIDLWGMRGNELTIIELKYKNKMVGIISELFFYLNVIRDIIKGDIAKPTDAIIDCEKELYMHINGIKYIHGRMLADKYHPLIEKKEVFEILDNSTYKNIPIDYKKDIFKYTPSNLEFV